MQQINMGFSQKLGVQFWGPCNKDYSILGSIFGVPAGVNQQDVWRIRVDLQDPSNTPSHYPWLTQ